MNAKPEVRVLIAASGSGGHLFPAIFVAQAFKRQCSNLKLGFIGSGRPLEKKILSDAQCEIYTLPVVGIKHRGLSGTLQSFLLMPRAFLKAYKLFRSFKPQVVVGVGGYVAVVPVVLARFMGIPTWIHEAEIKPGMANKFLKYFASKISVAFKEAELAREKNAVNTGHPVRESLRHVSTGLALGQMPRKILILGGSQGAAALDQYLPLVLAQFKDRNIEVRHQCREENVASVELSYINSGLHASVQSFISDMAEAYSWADIVIARSGAGTVMELGVVNRPAILIPYPHAQGDHQTINAKTLADAGRALLVKEGDNFVEQMAEALNAILNPNNYFAMKLAKYESRSLDAADKIATGCIELVSNI